MVYCICNLLCRAPYHRIGVISPVPFVGAITNCKKATATIVMSAGPFVRTEQLVDGFSRNLVIEYFSKILSRKFKFD